MDYEDLKAKLALAERKNKKVGIGFIVVFATILTPIFIFADTSGGSIIILIGFMFFMMACGILIFIKARLALNKILDESHPILFGIKSKTDYLVWTYQVVSKMEGDTSGKTVNNNVAAIGKDGKRYSFTAKNSDQAQETLSYLASAYPNIIVGYGLDNKHECERIIGKKLR